LAAWSTLHGLATIPLDGAFTAHPPMAAQPSEALAEQVARLLIEGLQDRS
jgi:hypothetical protein